MGRTYRRALETAGYTVVVVANAQGAIHYIDTQRPRLVVTELQLAEHNGVEFLYELRSYPDWQDLPVIILTSVPPQDAGLNDTLLSNLSVTKYCYKPHTTLQQLIEVVAENISP